MEKEILLVFNKGLWGKGIIHMKVLNKIAGWVGLELFPDKDNDEKTRQFYYTPNQQNDDDTAKNFLITWLVNSSEVSVRLSNAIKHPDFPFKTVLEYIAHPSPIDAVKKVQNIGRKTAYELDALIKDFLANPKKYEKHGLVVVSDLDTENPHEELAEEFYNIFDKYEFPRTLLSLPLSTRLENVLRNIIDEEREFTTISECVRHYDVFKEYLIRRPNFGKTSLKELESIMKSICSHILIRGGIEENTTHSILAYIFGYEDTSFRENTDLSILVNALQEYTEPDVCESDDENEAYASHENFFGEEEEITAEAIHNLIEGILKDRELDVLKKRFGLQKKIPATLDEIAKDYDCTRERIRQIEKKSLKKLRILKKAFSTYLVKEADHIKTLLFDDVDYFSFEESGRNIKTLPGEYRLGIEIAYGDIPSYLETICIAYKKYWLNTVEPPRLEQLKQLIDCDVAGKPLEKRIAEAVYDLKWQISLKSLAEKIPEYPLETIKEVLLQDFDAEITENEHIKYIRKNLRSSQRMIMVLKYAGRALSLSEVRAFHKQMFDHDVREHLIGAVLGRLEEALIVERGKYNLYENLELSPEEVDRVRQECLAYLNEKKIYVSAKRMFEDIYLGSHPYSGEFNPYMLMGILQDDRRFVCKRGLMIGLDTFSEEDFVGLNQKLYEIVDSEGPIDLKSIQERLSKDRKVLDVTVNIILEDSPNHLKVGPAIYDRVDRVLGNEQNIQRLNAAIELTLIDGKQTIHALRNKLEAVGFAYNGQIISSWLDKIDNVRRSREEVTLLEVTGIIDQYNKIFTECLGSENSLEHLKNKIIKSLENTELNFTALDFRLTKKYYQEMKNGDGHDDMSALLQEFGF